jgi:hypothetical protein
MAAPKKTLSFVASEETIARIKSHFPVSTGSEENLIKLINAFENPSSVVDNTLVEELQGKLKDNEISILTLIENNQKSNILLAEAQTQIETLEKEIIRMQQSNTEIETQVNSDKNRYYFVPKSQVIDALMNLTCQRLSEKMGKEITPAHIFTDMFLRYTIEQNAQWFYQFVVPKNEIKEIIG